MTENEAKTEIERHIQFLRENWKPHPDYDVIEALKTAIQALEETQQYRELGTVEEILKVFNNQQTIIASQHETLKQYRAIGTIEEFKALKEKNEPKKPTLIDYKKYIDVIENAKFLRGAYWCPNCKHTVRSGTYCEDCGQKLDWE